MSEKCPYCKEEFSDRFTVFCSACGTKHHKSCWEEHGRCYTNGCSGSVYTGPSAEEAKEKQVPPLPEILPEDFVINKRDVFKRKFDRQREKHGTWNWPAFLFGPYWFLYRKMYVPAVILYVLQQTIVLLSYTIKDFPFAMYLISLGFQFAVGSLADKFYMAKLEGWADQAKRMPETQRRAFILKTGGVNAAALFIGLAVSVALNLLLGL